MVDAERLLIMFPGVFDLGPHRRSDTRDERQTQSGRLL